jgi:YD repeat-containing protein
VQTFNPQQQVLTDNLTYADGSTDNSIYTYSPDGSYVDTEVDTPAGGSPTTWTYSYDALGDLVSKTTNSPDGSTEVQTFNLQQQVASDNVTYADGSTDNNSFTYASDGSIVQTEVVTPAGGTPTIKTYDYDSQQIIQNSNSYTPAADGSYTDNWSENGAQGAYSWIASMNEYIANWADADGRSWQDEYSYANGSGPGSGGSYTETYTSSNDEQGTRQYDATSNTTTVTWETGSTAQISTSFQGDAGFMGLVNQGELTNTQVDPTYFNPSISPTFNALLAGH